MSLVRPDVLIEIHYEIRDAGAPAIRLYTNARHEVIEEILSTWAQDQMMTGRDGSKPSDRKAFQIKIGLVLDDDSFCTESDTGNRGLTCGIVLDTLHRLSTAEAIEILPLSAKT